VTGCGLRLEESGVFVERSNMQFHEIADIFPLMSDAELQDLAADIRANGLIEAIWTYQGKIVDGRNRYKACLIANEEPRYQEWQGDEKDLLSFVLALNLKRRHLDASQRAVIGLAVEKYEAGRAKERLSTSSGGYLPRPLEKIPEAEKGNARDLAAAAVGVNPRYIQDAKRIEQEAPDLIHLIASGEMNIPQAKREMVKRARADSPPLPSEKYRIVYADPPWKYGNNMASGIVEFMERWTVAETHYTSMSIEELCALPVKDMIESDAVLFLWVTSPLLEECFAVISAWGFKYKTSFVWDKIKHNFGHYNSVRHELLLVCTRGSCTPDVPKLFDSVQSIERSDEHSEKPQEFREIIETLYTHGKRIELFARTPALGWDVWGNEI
jgi:N6-adenosine-specific RNA methylase IME4